MSNTEIPQDGSFDPSQVSMQDALAKLQAADQYTNSTSSAVDDRYHDDLSTILNIFFYKKPPTEEDYDDLMKAMKDLVSLCEKGDGKGNYPTKEMVYDIGLIADLMIKSGLKADAGPEGAAEVASWQNSGGIEVDDYRGNPINFRDFLSEAASTSGVNIGDQIENFAANTVYGNFADSLNDLSDHLNDSNALLSDLTKLLDEINAVGATQPPKFNFPPANAGDFGVGDTPPTSAADAPETVQIIYQFLNTRIGSTTGRPKGYTPHPGTDSQGNQYPASWYNSKDNPSWAEAFKEAYTYDVKQANQYMKDHPGTSFSDAMSLQTQSADVLNDYFNCAADPSDLSDLTTMLEQEYFQVEVQVLTDKGIDPEAQAEVVVNIYNEMDKWLKEYDPDGTKTATPGTEAYDMKQVMDDITKYFGDPPVATADNFTKWVLDLASPNSASAFHLNEAINQVKFLNGQAKQNLQTEMMEFQTFMRMMISVIESYQQMVKNVSQNVGR